MFYLNGLAVGQMCPVCSCYAMRDKGTLYAKSTRALKETLLLAFMKTAFPLWTVILNLLIQLGKVG